MVIVVYVGDPISPSSCCQLILLDDKWLFSSVYRLWALVELYDCLNRGDFTD